MVSGLIFGNNNKVPPTEDGVVIIAFNVNDSEFTSSDAGKVFFGSKDSFIDDTGTFQGPVRPTYDNKTADFNVDPAVRAYYVDCTSADVTATIAADDTTEHIFIRVDGSANDVFIVPSSGNINGGVSYTMPTTQYSRVTVSFNGTDYFAS